jgi:hypothetical protein
MKKMSRKKTQKDQFLSYRLTFRSCFFSKNKHAEIGQGHFVCKVAPVHPLLSPELLEYIKHACKLLVFFSVVESVLVVVLVIDLDVLCSIYEVHHSMCVQRHNESSR